MVVYTTPADYGPGVINENKKLFVKSYCENDYCILISMWVHIVEKPFSLSQVINDNCCN